MPVCPNRSVDGLMGAVISIGKLGAGQKFEILLYEQHLAVTANDHLELRKFLRLGLLFARSTRGGAASATASRCSGCTRSIALGRGRYLS